jgi:hypothetical protein
MRKDAKRLCFTPKIFAHARVGGAMRAKRFERDEARSAARSRIRWRVKTPRAKDDAHSAFADFHIDHELRVAPVDGDTGRERASWRDRLERVTARTHPDVGGDFGSALRARGHTERVHYGVDLGRERESATLLAAAPDFRYVGLEPAQDLGGRVAASLFLAGGGVGVGLLRELGLLSAAVGAFLAATGLALVWRRVTAPMRRVGTQRVPFAIVPWGVLVDDTESPRVLRWAAVRSLHVHTMYGRDTATPSTLWSYVTLRTDHELFAGRTPGAAPLERLLAHLESYAREQSHAVALDLEGERPSAIGPLEPEFERLLSSAQESIMSGPSSQRLGLETTYRTRGPRAAGSGTIESLRTILRDRSEHELDRRPLAAVVAAELGLYELVPELVALVQSPHPMVAASAKAAGIRLGAAQARCGDIDEVAPFLPPEDVEALRHWIAAAPVGREAARRHLHEVRSA